MKNLINKIVILFFIIICFISTSKAFASSSWPTSHTNNQNNAAIFDFVGNQNGINNFVLNIEGATYLSNILAVDKIVYFAKNMPDSSSDLFAVSIDNGTVIWQKNFPMKINNIVHDSGRVYFGSGSIFCLNAKNGNEIWKIDKNNQNASLKSSYVYKVNNGVVFGWWSVLTNSDKFFAINSVDKSLISDLGGYDMKYVYNILFDDDRFYLIDDSYNPNTNIRAYNLKTYNLVWSSQNCTAHCNNAMLDKEEKTIYLSAANSRFCGYSTETGEKKFMNNTALAHNLVKYGNTIYSFEDHSSSWEHETADLVSFDADFQSLNLNYEKKVLDLDHFSTDPVIVNNVIYGGTSNGYLWAKNLDSGKVEISPVLEGGWIQEMIYSDGRLLFSVKSGSEQNLIIKKINDIGVVNDEDGKITLESPYKTDGVYNSYLGQLHSHYIPDLNWSKVFNAPLPTVFSVEKSYKDAGYNFIALTEHNKVEPSPNVEGILHLQNSEEDTPGLFQGSHILAVGINEGIDEMKTDQERIDQINRQGGIPILAHTDSWVYGWSGKQLLELKDYEHIEVFNSAVDKSPMPDASSLNDLDFLLSRGKKVLATAGDDYTPGYLGFDGAGISVLAKKLDQSDILTNLKDGNFYANQGSGSPKIDVGIKDEKVIEVISDKSSNIRFIGKNGKLLKEMKGVTDSTYEPTGDEIYVRVEVESGGKKTWSQAIFVNEIKTEESGSKGKYYFNLLKAKVTTSFTNLVAAILPSSSQPKQTPPTGYLGPVYTISSSQGNVEGTKIGIDYDSTDSTKEDDLSIYHYNQDDSEWEEVASEVDKESKIVIAEVNEPGKYTIGAKAPENDNTGPELELLSPENLSNLSGVIDFKISAVDVSSVRRIGFYIDENLISVDSDVFDGWSVAIKTSNFKNGDHKLKVVAEDFYGNKSEKEYLVNFANTTSDIPVISIMPPSEKQILSGQSTMMGSVFTRSEKVDHVEVFMDDAFLNNAKLSGSSFAVSMNWLQFKEGTHALKFVAVTKGGIRASLQRSINIKKPVKTTLTSLSTFSQLKNIPVSLLPYLIVHR
ncbi:MAG: Ig-like domain-containing protein [Patescibacteria group bacterium]